MRQQVVRAARLTRHTAKVATRLTRKIVPVRQARSEVQLEWARQRTAYRDAVARWAAGPDEEVVSVAWSPDGAWLAYLVSPGGSICAELHVIRPDGSGRRLLAGADPRATVFAGGWAGPGSYVCSIAPGDGPAFPFPSREETPWTHGGPPAEYVPTDEDAMEDWS